MPTKKWYCSKTIWVAIITAIVGVSGILHSQYPTTGLFITITGILNIILRLVTTTTIE